MAPVQAPTPDGKEGSFKGNKRQGAKKKTKNVKRKAIPLDPISLTFLATRCEHDDKGIENSKHNSQVNVDFFSAVLESVKPAVFVALDTRV